MTDIELQDELCRELCASATDVDNWGLIHKPFLCRDYDDLDSLWIEKFDVPYIFMHIESLGLNEQYQATLRSISGDSEPTGRLCAEAALITLRLCR
jgi:hypothetical protein